jgi:surface antigen
MKPLVRALSGVLVLLLAGCGGEPEPVRGDQQALLSPPSGPMQCVPYARSVSGINIRGDAWTWWSSAEDLYERGDQPREGAVLVFARTDRLRRGHVSVVTKLLNRREILITHANWASNGTGRGQVTRDVPVVDVSPGNDWSQVRVWNGDGAFGRIYPAYGFIYPNRLGPVLTSELPVCVSG